MQIPLGCTIELFTLITSLMIVSLVYLGMVCHTTTQCTNMVIVSTVVGVPTTLYNIVISSQSHAPCSEMTYACVFNDNIVLKQMPEKAITGPPIGYGDLSSHVLSWIAVNNIFPQNEYVGTTMK